MIEDRFWANVATDVTGCWPWTGGHDRDGYGKLTIVGRTVKAHRIAYEIHFGPIPEPVEDEPMLCVLHHCDYPPCVRPDHLYLGTNAVNTAERDAKGRGAWRPGHRHNQGERNANARLTDALVLELRARHAAGESQSALAREHGVTQSLVSQVVRRTRWRHV